MFDIEQVSEWRGLDVVDPENHRVGRLEEIYTDNYGSSPGFACVKTGLFGRRLTFVPLAGATMARDHVRVAYPAEQIKLAPSVEPDGQLSAVEEAALFDHYGLSSTIDPAAGMPLPAAPAPPRLLRHHTEAAAAHIAEVRQLAGDPVEPAAAGLAGAAGAVEERLRALEERVAELEDWRGR